jgi:3-hydroxy-9,10-secoandrosta-1,3,5(10)-triene-9,17-dione monooxygenase
MSAVLKTEVSNVVFADAAEAVAAARVLTPRFAERAQKCEELRRAPDESLAELHASGLMRMFQPKRFGGSELGADAMFEVILEMCKGCASTTWVWFNLASHSWNIGQFGLQAQEDVWGNDPHALAAGGLAFPCGKASKAEGGYKLSGRWPFGSGIDGANWHLVGAMVDEGEGKPPSRRLFLVPQSDYKSLDNWRAYGLTGSGSHDVEVKDAFVPEHRTLEAGLFTRGVDVPGNKVNPSPWFRAPSFAVFGFSLAQPPIGIARTALAEFIEGMKKRAGLYTGVRLAELAPMQMRIAEASACVEIAENQLRSDMAEMMRMVEAGEEPSMDRKMAWKRNCAFEGQLCVRAIDSLMVASGAGGLSLGGRMQRHFRDIHAATAHIALTWDVQATAYGMHALALPPQPGLLI